MPCVRFEPTIPVFEHWHPVNVVQFKDGYFENKNKLKKKRNKERKHMQKRRKKQKNKEEKQKGEQESNEQDKVWA
jgi:hypothetical protein